MNILSQINDLIKSVAGNPYAVVLAYVVGIVGLLLTITLRERKTKILRHGIVSTLLIESGKSLYSKLNVTYNRRIVSSLTDTKFIIFNDGTEVIRPDDIAPSDPIQISIPENVKLLGASITQASNALNYFRIRKEKNHIVQINFEYIEPNDFVIIQLLHTGNKSSSPHISGTVIGAKPPFVPKKQKGAMDFTNISSPMGKILGRMMFLSSANSLNQFFSIIIVLICGIISYFLFATSYNFVGIACALPGIFFFIVIIISVLKPATASRNWLNRQIARAMLLTALSEDEKPDKQGEEKLN